MFHGERGIRRKTFPRSRTNNGSVHKGPDVPKIETYALDPKFVPDGVRNIALEGSVDKKRVRRNIETHGTECASVIKKPIFEFFVTSFGGQRTGGGGTSEGTLARAKRKFKRPGRRLKVK